MKMGHTQNDRGAVLLTTLLVMAIMAALTVALMDDIRLALKRTLNVSDYAQADWYVRGAEDYVADVLTQQLSSVEENNRNQVLEAINPIILPLDNGVMALNIRDGSHCFNMGSLTTVKGSVNTLASDQLLHLFEAIGVPLNTSELLRARILDWVDADSQPQSGGAEDGNYLRRDPPLLPANAQLSSIMELRAIEGVNEDIYQIIRPWLCVGEAYTLSSFNIDAATPLHAPLLASYLGGIDNLPLAERLLLERPSSGYGDLATLNETPIIKGLSETDAEFKTSELWNNHIIFTPQSIWVELDLTYRKAQRSRSFHFIGVENNNPVLVYRGWGRESFLPSLNLEDILGNENTPDETNDRGNETQ